MNRAYQERILREERRLEEEEDRHRLGGAYVSERPEDGEDTVLEKKNRRRQPTGTTNQRRPKTVSKPMQTQPEPVHQPMSESSPQPIPQPARSHSIPQSPQPLPQETPHPASSSYQSPSHLQNLTQQKISGQLNAAVRSRAKSDAQTQQQDAVPDPVDQPSSRPIPAAATASAVKPTVTPVASSAPTVSRNTLPESDPLPEGWEEVCTEEGNRYYYHKITRMSRSVVDRPTPSLPPIEFSSMCSDGKDPLLRSLQLSRVVSTYRKNKWMRVSRGSDARESSGGSRRKRTPSLHSSYR